MFHEIAFYPSVGTHASRTLIISYCNVTRTICEYQRSRGSICEPNLTYEVGIPLNKSEYSLNIFNNVRSPTLPCSKVDPRAGFRRRVAHQENRKLLRTLGRRRRRRRNAGGVVFSVEKSHGGSEESWGREFSRWRGTLVLAERNSHLSTFGAYRIISCKILWPAGVGEWRSVEKRREITPSAASSSFRQDQRGINVYGAPASQPGPA